MHRGLLGIQYKSVKLAFTSWWYFSIFRIGPSTPCSVRIHIIMSFTPSIVPNEMRNAYDIRNADMIFKLQNSQHPNINTNDLYQFTPSISNKNRQYRVTKPVALVLAPVSQKPVVPVFQNWWYRFRPAAHSLARSARNRRRKGSRRSRGARNRRRKGSRRSREMLWCLPHA